MLIAQQLPRRADAWGLRRTPGHLIGTLCCIGRAALVGSLTEVVQISEEYAQLLLVQAFQQAWWGLRWTHRGEAKHDLALCGASEASARSRPRSVYCSPHRWRLKSDRLIVARGARVVHALRYALLYHAFSSRHQHLSAGGAVQ
jgi:hypothetical protein